MPAGKGRGVGKSDVRRGFFEPQRIDDLALDESSVRLAGDRLDDESDKPVAVVGILEAGVGTGGRLCA